SGGGRGVKEKDLNRNKKSTTLGIGEFTDSEDTMNDDTPICVASAVREGVTLSMVDMMVEMGKQNSLDDTTVLISFPPLSTLISMAGNAPGKSSYANITSKPSGKKLNVRTLFTPGGNGIDVVVLVDSIRAISECFANTAYGFFGEEDENLLKEDVSTVSVWVKLHGVLVTAFSEDGLSAIATKLVMIELQADVELRDNIVVAMPKITREGHYTCNVHVEYEWKPPRCSSCKVFGHIHEECPKNIGAGEKKTMKKPSQTSQGILVGQKMGFKPKQVFQPVSKKSTTNTHRKMNNHKSIKEVSKSNPFEVLTSVDNDEDLGTNEGIANSADKGTNNVSSSNTPIGEKIEKIKRQICEGKLRFMDNDGNPLVPTGIVESDSEVEVVFDETTNLRILTGDNDDYDPYDDDIYENQDLSEHLHSICDDLDITVRGRKKK
ncbi:hypothetical protein Tco_0844803, partial [Tanacetum coccineum]